MMRTRTLLTFFVLAAAAIATLAAARGRAAQSAALPSGDELVFTIIHTSDEHSAVLPSPLVDHQPGGRDGTRGGFARLAAAVEALRGVRQAAGEPVLLTSAGDNLSGTPFAWLMLEGAAPELGLLVELGYDVITLGNHEWDYDSERLARYIAAAGYPAAAARTALLASNTEPPPGHPLGQLGITRTHITELPNGLRVGFFGLLGRGAARFATRAAPVAFSDARAAAVTAVADLRAAGADIVIAVTHSGVDEDRELARDVDGIDLILGGHDHVLLPEPVTEAGTLIVHPGAHLGQLLVLDLAWDRTSGRLRTRNAQTGTPLVVPLDSTWQESAWMAERVAQYRQQLEARIAGETAGRFSSLDGVVARSGFALRAGPPMQETPLGNFVTDAMRAVASEATGVAVDFAFQANGVLRGDIVPGTLPHRRGELVLYDVASVVGMGSGPDGSAGYPLVSVWLTGEEVRRVLEVSVLLSELLRNSYYLQVSGLQVRYDRRRAILFRIPFRGTPVPTGRAVLQVHRAAGDSVIPLTRGDTTLYHVVTDYYVASFLPMVGRMLPRLAIRPRDQAGNEITIDDAIVRRDGAELKVWQAVLEFAAAQPAGSDVVPAIDSVYSAAEGRLIEERGMPLWLLPLLALIAGAMLVFALLRRRRHEQRGRATLRAFC